MTGTPAQAERLSRLFRYFAATQCRGRSLVYETLSNGVAADDTLLDLLMRTPGEQRRPSLLFAAVNAVLAARPEAALAAYYPIHGGTRPVDDQLMVTFGTFCAEHADELAELLSTRSTQTNEIRRCVALRLALNHIGKQWPESVALVEIGASAGLNLRFDRYSYRVGDEETGDSPVRITCAVKGNAPRLLDTTPKITTRLGLDLHPIQLADPGQRAWLAAFIWPEDVDGLTTLRAAINLAATTETATVQLGDATRDTARRLAEIPGDEHIVVFTASLLSYLNAPASTAFTSQLNEASQHRPIAWAFAESPGLAATTDLRLPALDGPLAHRNGLYALGTSLRQAGHHEDALLAMADPYLRWLAPARHATDDFQWLAS